MSVGRLLLALLLVALNAFFVAAEFAVIKVRGSRVEELARAGSRAARVVQRIQSRLDTYLSATQLGVTLASLGLGWVGEPAVAAAIEPLFKPLGSVISVAAAHIVGVVVAFTVITYFHIVFGELAPKWLAIQKPDSLALAIAFPLDIFYRIFYPVIWLLGRTARWILTALGVHPATEGDSALSESELRIAISHSQEGGTIAESAEEIADRAFHFGRSRVRDVMTPRPEVVFLSTEWPLSRNLEVIRTTRFARYPLCHNGLDDVIGRVHVRDLLPIVMAGEPADRRCDFLEGICAQVLFVPENKPLDTMLDEFQTQRMEMAVVQDEYGVTAGVVTLEDVLEELVGEIQQEFTPNAPEIERQTDGSYLVDGKITLGRLVRDYDIGAEVPDVETIGGYLLSTLTGHPRVGDVAILGNWRVEVAELVGRRIRRCRLIPLTSDVHSRGQAS